MPEVQTLTPFLWFDDQAEEAANFYVSVFKNSKIGDVSRYGEVGQEFHGKPVASAMIVGFELDGMKFTALNGGPMYKFTEAISFQISCETQEDVDYYWEKLGEGGDEKAQQCGWLKDKFGLSWQVVPAELPDVLGGPDHEGSQRAMAAMMQMKKLDIGALKKAYAG